MQIGTMGVMYCRYANPLTRMLLWSALIACGLCGRVLADTAQTHSDDTLTRSLPRPASIQPWVDFWIDVYGKNHDGVLVIHDERDVSVIYATLETPPGQSLLSRRERAAPEIDAFRDALHQIASGEDNPASPYQDRVKTLFQDQLDADTLKEAATHIRFQVGHANAFQDALVIARSWRPWINRVLDAHGLPRELGAMPFVESFFRNSVAPDSGARGIWQFTESAGRRDMHLAPDIDERLSFYKSTLAAARLLSHNYAITRRWPLAVTAYNHGTRGIIRATREFKTRDLGVIARRYDAPDFGFASRNFYAQVLAVAHVEANSTLYFQDQLPVETRSTRFALQLTQPRSLHEISVDQNVSVAGLLASNPDIIDKRYADGKRLPAGITVWINCVSDCPEPGSNVITARERNTSRYTVQAGDTLGHIALRVGSTVAELARANRIAPGDTLRIGQQLAVPGSQTESGFITFPSELRLDDTYDGRSSARSTRDRLRPASADNTTALLAQLRASRPTAPDPNETQVVLPDADIYKLLQDGKMALLHGESTGLVARWLDIDTQSLHTLNGLSENAVLDIGHTLNLGFANVTKAEFERRRLYHHRNRQYAWYAHWEIVGTIDYQIQPGDRLWRIAANDFNVPQWLLLEYNPNLDFNRTRPGQIMRLPRVTERANSADDSKTN